VIAATRRDLEAEVAAGRFRDDLFFRLAVARVARPPLRERVDDIESLARHFWAVHNTVRALPFPEHVLGRLCAYAWPGNVRELANTMARLAAFGELATHDDDLFMRRPTIPAPPPTERADFIDGIVVRDLPLAAARELVMAEFERRYLAFLDATYGDDRARVSASGVSDRYLRTLRARARENG
jgi:DNA-binding NtrC family response regulator